MIVVLLDVDGVINVDSERAWPGRYRSGHARAFGGWEYRITWAPQAVARLRALHETGLVELRWCTTWVDHDPDQISDLVGLPRLASAFPPDSIRPYMDDHRARYRWEKLAAALDVVRACGRLVWLDDEIPATGPERAELDAAGAMLVIPDEHSGLRPEDLDEVEAFAKRQGPHGG